VKIASQQPPILTYIPVYASSSEVLLEEVGIHFSAANLLMERLSENGTDFGIASVSD
jgi:hypothetical protein